MTLQEKREYDRVRMAKWLKNNPEKREANRLKNAVWRAKDRAKHNQYMREWKFNNIDKVRRYKWKSRFGITPEQYDELFIFQRGVCAVCGKPERKKHNKSNRVQMLSVDHDHVTGQVQGLLCQDCNIAIGYFHNNTKRMRRAITYLKDRA